MDFSLVRSVYAQTVEDAPRLCELENVVGSVIGIALAIGGIALFIMIIWGGFLWLTSGSNDQQVAQARGTLTWAVGGLVLMVASFFILRLIEEFTGVTVTTFDIPWFDGAGADPC